MLKRPVLVKITAENYVWIDESEVEQFINCKNSLRDWTTCLIPKAEIIKPNTSWHEEDGQSFSKTESIMIPENSKIISINIEKSIRENVIIKEEIELT